MSLESRRTSSIPALSAILVPSNLGDGFLGGDFVAEMNGGWRQTTVHDLCCMEGLNGSKHLNGVKHDQGLILEEGESVQSARNKSQSSFNVYTPWPAIGLKAFEGPQTRTPLIRWGRL